MSASDSSLPLRMTEASIEGQEVQHIPLTGFAPCGLEKWGFRRYAPTSPVPRREGPYNQSLSAPLTSAFAFLWACDLSRDLLPAVAHPRSPAAGFAKGNKKGSSSKLGCLSISFCGERGILIIIPPYSVIYRKYIDNMRITHRVILPYIVIFRIILGDYLGD